MKKIILAFSILLSGCGLKAIEDGMEKNGVHTINAGWVSSFAIPVSDEQVILVDTGGEEDAASTLLGLESLGYAPEDVSHIFEPILRSRATQDADPSAGNSAPDCCRGRSHRCT